MTSDLLPPRVWGLEFPGENKMGKKQGERGKKPPLFVYRRGGRGGKKKSSISGLQFDVEAAAPGPKGERSAKTFEREREPRKVKASKKG